MLVGLTLPLIGVWVKLLKVPYHVLFPVIMAFCSIGVYSVNSNVYDLYAVAGFGLLGYDLLKLRCEPAPLLLGFVLGPLLEENLRRAMILGRGDPATFLTRPISATLLALTLLVLMPAVRKNGQRCLLRGIDSPQYCLNRRRWRPAPEHRLCRASADTSAAQAPKMQTPAGLPRSALKRASSNHPD